MSTIQREKFSNLSNDIKLSIQEIVTFAQSLSGEALVCVSDQLCWVDGNEVTPVTSPPELFARIDHYAEIDWKRNGITKEEFFAGAKHYVPRYDWSSVAPHFPPVSKVLYTTDAPMAASTGWLDELIDRIATASEDDAQLLKAFIMTPFWGGPCGKRPAFTFTADGEPDKHKGRGVGKTTCVELLSKLVGGTIPLRPTLSPDRVMALLLSPSARNQRIALFDNVKAFLFSSDLFESLVTAEVIGGHRLHHGFASRPNYLTFALTVNGASYSKDMAERSVVIKLTKPKRKSNWYEQTNALINEHRDEIIADVRWHLTRKKATLRKLDRWEVWSSEVLARLPEPNELIQVLQQRRQEIDEDDQASADLAQHVEACIRGHSPGTKTATLHAFIPSPLMLQWVRLLKPDLGFKQLHGFVAQHSGDRIVGSRTNTARGFLWTGAKADTDLPPVKLAYDLKSHASIGTRGGDG